MRWRPIFLRLGVVLLLTGGGFMGYRSYEEHKRNAQIQSEIDMLQQEAEKIRRENETLVERIEYFASPDFQEQEAKKKLGLRRQEESMMAVREDPSLVPSPMEKMSEAKEQVQVEGAIPNYQNWWRQFFHSSE